MSFYNCTLFYKCLFFSLVAIIYFFCIVKWQLSAEKLTREFLISVFGVNPVTIQIIQCDKFIADIRHQFAKFLLHEDGLNAGIGTLDHANNIIESAVPSANFDLYQFLSKLIFQIMTSRLLNEALGKEESMFKSFVDFEKNIAKLMSGMPIELFPESLKGYFIFIIIWTIDTL